MRITGGVWASRKLAGVGRAPHLRPTPDALREQAFAVLAPRLEGAVFLDLFAGSGVNALEALSRGAARAYLIERHAGSIELIRRNLELVGVEDDRAAVVRADVRRAVRRLGTSGVRASVAWCDPPFASLQDGVDALAEARRAGVLEAGAVALLERPTRQGPCPDGFVEVRGLRGAVLLEVL